jgi:rod shape-determining protein MreD
MNFLVSIVSLLIAVALQVRLPTGLGLHLEFLPALVVYDALTSGRGTALLLALAAGLMQDALSAGPFGVTALVYGIAALILSAMREAFDRDLPWVQMGAGALVSAAVSVTACVSHGFTLGALVKIALLAGLSAVVTPLLFFGLDYLRLLWRTS